MAESWYSMLAIRPPADKVSQAAPAADQTPTHGGHRGDLLWQQHRIVSQVEVPSTLKSRMFHPRQDPMTPLRPINETWESGLIDDYRLNVVAPQIG